MSILFFTDPHLGFSLKSHSTPKSRRLMRSVLTLAVQGVIRRFADHRKTCVGDWYHSFSNDEDVIQETAPLFEQVDDILAGNHDLAADAGKVSTLQLLRTLLGPDRVIVGPHYGKPYYTLRSDPEARLYFVPHVATQDVFEESLKLAYKAAKQDASPLPKFLMLHCNIDSGFAEGHDISLNLTTENAEQLLKVFDYILVGHEHIPRDLLGGRLIVMGNTHPTSFADLSDKRVLVLENGELRDEVIWRAEEGYLLADWRDAEPLPTTQFLRLTGVANGGEALEVGKRVRELWEANPQMLAIKVDVVMNGMAEVEATQNVRVINMREIVARELETEPDLLALWTEVTTEGEAA